MVVDHPLLEYPAKFLPEAAVLHRLVPGHVLQQIEQFLDAAAANGIDVPTLLQDLARDIERQIVGVNHAAHETQIGRQQLFGIVHDEDAAHVQLDAAPVFAIPQVEGGVGRQVQQHRVLLLAFDARMHMRERRLEVMRHVLVKLIVLIVVDFLARSRPQRGGTVDRFLALPVYLNHSDGDGDVVGIFTDDGLQPVGVEKVVLTRPQLQDHLGAARFTLDVFDRVTALPVRAPAHAVFGAEAGAARDQCHFLGDDEGRVKADAELADQACVLLLIAGQRGEELARAGLGDGADVVDDFAAAHADAVVDNRQRARFLVHPDADAKIGIAFEEGIVAERLETQLVAGVRGIGDQFAEKNLLVAVQRVDHQVQQLPDLGLEAERFGLGGGGHGSSGKNMLWVLNAK